MYIISYPCTYIVSIPIKVDEKVIGNLNKMVNYLFDTFLYYSI